jgi:hypothetical protein
MRQTICLPRMFSPRRHLFVSLKRVLVSLTNEE